MMRQTSMTRCGGLLFLIFPLVYNLMLMLCDVMSRNLLSCNSYLYVVM